MAEIKTVLLIAGGADADENLIREQAAAHNFVLALDSGADTALKAGVKPDLVLGDLDSVSEEAKKILGPKRLFKINRQDNTDLEKGLSFLKVMKPRKITVLCLTGGRLDFTLSNFWAILEAAKSFTIEVIADGWRIYPLRKSAVFAAQKGVRVSLIPFTDIKQITLTGLKYPLKNETLKTGQRAISNKTTKKEFSVEFKSGKLLVMVENK